VTAGGHVVGRDFLQEIHQHINQAGQPAALYVNVPPQPRPLHGREMLLADLVARLCNGTSTALSAQGLPGVGKTTLAAEVARHPTVLAHFTDGVLWASVGPRGTVAAIQAAWAAALNVDLRALIDPHARRQRLDNVIGQRKLLIVLDDIWDATTAQQLRSAGPHVVHLLTTREQPIATDFAGHNHALAVPVLNDDAGYALLHELAPAACAADPVAARALVRAVGALPLAIELLGGYLAAPERSFFPDLIEEAFPALADPQTRLDLAGERLGAPGIVTTLQATIELSLDALRTAYPAAVDTFYALGAFAPSPAHFTRAAAEAATGCTGATLAVLIARNLVEQVGAGAAAAQGAAPDHTERERETWLALHQTLADVARTQLPAHAVEAHREYYLAVVQEDREDWQRIATLYDQLVGARAQLMASVPDSAALVDLVDAVSTYQRRQGLWLDLLQWLQQALPIVETAAEPREIARLQNNMGLVYSALGEKQEALGYYEQALPLRRQVGDRWGESVTRYNLALIYRDLGRLTEAVAELERVVAIDDALGHPDLESDRRMLAQVRALLAGDGAGS